MANMIMLEFGGFGMIRETKFKRDYVRDRRRATIVIDELNNVFWVWLGHDITQKTRNQLNSVIEKLRINGHVSEGIKLGLNCQGTIIIDQKNLSDPVVAENYQKLLSLFDLPAQPKGKYIMEIQASSTAAQVLGFTPKDRAIAGLLIASILEEYPALFIGKNAKNEYAIEGDEPLLRFKIVNGRVQLLPGSKNLTDKIQRVFSELYNYLK
ncbi:MAG: hypothetical protein ACTSRP_07875 [Candidatus Helarchaeota archaeon]